MEASPEAALAALPHRGRFGDSRPRELAGLGLPPRAMPSHGPRPLKAWRYVGAYNPDIMVCMGAVRVGPFRQSFWAVWDRRLRQLHQNTVMGRRREVRLERGVAAVRSRDVRIELALAEVPGIETISRSGDSYGWTRKQGGVRTTGRVIVGDVARELRALAVIDDTAAYYERHTTWRWCAGVGVSPAGGEVAWNLVEGVHDSPRHSERTVWVEGDPHEVGPLSFDPELRGVGGLHFAAEAERSRHDNLLLVRSIYRQPFGTFRGELPGGVVVAEGYGVMESHDAWW